MASRYTAGSFTKNFSWNLSYNRLHVAVRNGFSAGLEPVTRDLWRHRSEINDPDRELIPLNFFLYSVRGLAEDFVLVDRLVERSHVTYDADFARLSLFAFHLAASGSWHRSKWPDGKVAGWANEFIRQLASGDDGQWRKTAFTEASMKAFIDDRIDGEDVTKTKLLTNYRYMLRSAGVLADGQLQPPNLTTPWPVGATQLFWDRQIFDGTLGEPSLDQFEAAFYKHEIHKLLGCSEMQGRAFVLAAYKDYAPRRITSRLKQMHKLRKLLAA